jgi:hypothetical protein
MVVQLGSSNLYGGKRWRWVVAEEIEILDQKTNRKTRSLLPKERENRKIKIKKIVKTLPLLMARLVGSVRWVEMEMDVGSGRRCFWAIWWAAIGRWGRAPVACGGKFWWKCFLFLLRGSIVESRAREWSTMAGSQWV